MAKMSDIIATADSSGRTVAEVAGIITARDRAKCSPAPINSLLYETLLSYLDLSDYLDDYVIQ